jgi:hypothetical protein
MNLAQNRGLWVLSGIVVGLAIVGTSILFWFDPASYGFYPVCLFHRTTGLLCPGCGSLRALHQMLHGNFAAAFRFNPLLVISLPLLIWFGALFAIKTLRHQRSSFQQKWLWLSLGVGLAFGILRNLPIGPFAQLHP